MATTTAADEGKKDNLRKGFRANVEVENFYRYINENNLRLEAHTLLRMVLQKNKKSGKRASKKRILQ